MVWPEAIVSAKCSDEASAPPGLRSSRPSCAISRRWLPCGWYGWLSSPALTIRISAGRGLVGA